MIAIWKAEFEDQIIAILIFEFIGQITGESRRIEEAGISNCEMTQWSAARRETLGAITDQGGLDA